MIVLTSVYINAMSLKTARLIAKWDRDYVAERLLGTGGKRKTKKFYEVEPSYGVIMSCCCNMDTVPIVGESIPLELLNSVMSMLAKESMIVDVTVENKEFDEDNGWRIVCTSPPLEMMTYERYMVLTHKLIEDGWHVAKVNDMRLGTAELESHWPGKD
jgi:hypothetical protein